MTAGKTVETVKCIMVLDQAGLSLLVHAEILHQRPWQLRRRGSRPPGSLANRPSPGRHSAPRRLYNVTLNRNGAAAMNICLVEDNRDLGEAVERHLRKAGHAVTWNVDGSGVEALVASEDFDVVILDLTLPAGDGSAILRRLRRQRHDMPVLVATAKAEIDDRVSLLDLGADDYLVKPFDMRELDARLRAIVRRRAGQQSSQIHIGRLVMDQGGQIASIAGRPLELGLREFRVLELLVAGAGRVVSRERLMSRLFDMEDGGSINALELLVSRVRRKIAGAGAEIVTIRGIGYLARVREDVER